MDKKCKYCRHIYSSRGTGVHSEEETLWNMLVIQWGMTSPDPNLHYFPVSTPQEIHKSLLTWLIKWE
jgi:hypothetical protein